MAALAAAGCGRSGSGTSQPTAAAPSGGGSSSTASGSASPAATAGPGDFGTLKKICGPGTAHGGSGRGITASTIRIGVTADPGAAAAPGLEQEFFDMGEGFVKWCNAAGGINGRKIILDKLDAKLFNVGQVTTAACQKDFMLVGNGNAFDSAGVKIREACKLGQIPAYVTSPQAVSAMYQAQSTYIPPTQINDGGLRLLAETYPDAKTGGIGIASSTLSSIIPGGLKAQAYLKDVGIKVATLQQQPPTVDNYRPYLEQMKQEGARGLFQISAQDPSPIWQAMKNVGWTPSFILYSTQFYGPQGAAAAKAASSFPPSYVQFGSIPIELANKYPVVQQMIDIIKGAVASPKLTTFSESAMSAWALFAESATECGDNLTQECVLAKAASHDDWTAGGLYPKHSTKPGGNASPCIAMVKFTPTGFIYDQDVTQPTTGDFPFNCDPENVKTVDSYQQN